MGHVAGLLGTPRDWARDVGFATLTGVCLGVLGPFGSYLNGGLQARLAYWVGLFWAGVLIYGLIMRFSLRYGERARLPVWFSVPAGILAASAPMALVVRLIATQVWQAYVAHMSALDWYFQVLAVAAPLVVGYVALARRLGWWNEHAISDAGEASVASHAAHSAEAETKRPFLDRLPARLGRDLLCLQMEDHYVRAHTRLGSELILLPLSKAIHELEGVEGERVHRSWWVARVAVAGPVELGRNLRLRLVNGLRVPVSRSSVARLRSAGWIPALRQNDSPESKP